MINRKLKSIAVSRSPGHVGLSFGYDSGPASHILLPMNAARDLRNRINEALEQTGATGDGVGVSEHVSLKLS